MRSCKPVFPPFLFYFSFWDKAPEMLWFFCRDGSGEFAFNLGLSREKRKKRKGSEWRRRKRREGVWLMSTRCLTFGGSRILWSFSWCVICAGAYVRGDAGAAFTCRGDQPKRLGITAKGLKPSSASRSWMQTFVRVNAEEWIRLWWCI